MSTQLPDVSDEELWAEVERRQLAIVVGYINPDQVSDYPEINATTHDLTKGHVLWTRTWVNRWPVYGLRGGDTVKSREREAE